MFERAVARFGDAPAGLSQLLIGGREAGEALVDDKRVALVSATGSTRMGRAVAPRLAQRFARAILELGGNNGVIVAPRSEEHTSELQSLMRISYAVFCLKKQTTNQQPRHTTQNRK